MPIFTLPSEVQLKRKISTAFRTEDGDASDFLEEQAKTYSDRCPNGKKLGLLVCDEMKIVGKIMWNSKNHQFYGSTSDLKDLTCLDDLFTDGKSEKTVKEAEFVFQTIWRDLSANCDVIGPYWKFAKQSKSHEIHRCMMEAMRQFHQHDFKVLGVIMDGATTNVSVIKTLLLSRPGMFPVKENTQQFDYNVPSSFDNPFDFGQKVPIRDFLSN